MPRPSVLSVGTARRILSCWQDTVCRSLPVRKRSRSGDAFYGRPYESGRAMIYLFTVRFRPMQKRIQKAAKIPVPQGSPTWHQRTFFDDPYSSVAERSAKFLTLPEGSIHFHGGPARGIGTPGGRSSCYTVRHSQCQGCVSSDPSWQCIEQIASYCQHAIELYRLSQGFPCSSRRPCKLRNEICIFEPHLICCRTQAADGAPPVEKLGTPQRC